jgi:hypothetical protein
MRRKNDTETQMLEEVDLEHVAEFNNNSMMRTTQTE